MQFDELTPEQIEKAKVCKTADELLELANAEGVELTDEQIEQVSGGRMWNHPGSCPACGKENIYHYGSEYYCRDCGHKWTDGGW